MRHRWDVDLKEAYKIQNRLRKHLQLKNALKRITLIAGTDVAFSNNLGYGCVVVMSYPELKLKDVLIRKDMVRFPYIRGYLTFREGQLLYPLLEKIKKRIDLILFDGQGICHPRNMGLASHLGILLDKPSIGCAKSLLYGKYELPANQRGSYSYIRLRDNFILGVALRTRNGIKPVFVSPGHKIDLQSSIEIILNTSRYRIPEPLRYAHKFANKYLQRRKDG